MAEMSNFKNKRKLLMSIFKKFEESNAQRYTNALHAGYHTEQHEANKKPKGRKWILVVTMVVAVVIAAIVGFGYLRPAWCYKKGKEAYEVKDYAQAVSWFRKAAELGVARAQINLALCYYKGEGVTKNLEQARFWARKALQSDDIEEWRESNLKSWGLVE